MEILDWPQLEEVILAETRAAFPVADCRVLWADQSGDRALGVVDVFQLGSGFLRQVCCLREGGRWFAWTEGPAPGWLDVDETFGLVTRLDVLEEGTTSVELECAGEHRTLEVSGHCMFQVLWDVSSDDDELEWPAIVRIRVDDRWWVPALPDVPVRTAFLIDALLRYGAGDADTDPNFWAWELVDEAIMTDPAHAWTVVRDAIRVAQDDRALYWLAAGPLEDLVEGHLDVLIDEIEAEARRDRQLRRALSGVWVTVRDETLARRLAAVTEP